MFSATSHYSVFRVLTATALFVLLCAGTAMILVGWTPGQTGLPADVAKIQSSQA